MVQFEKNIYSITIDRLFFLSIFIGLHSPLQFNAKKYSKNEFYIPTSIIIPRVFTIVHSLIVTYLIAQKVHQLTSPVRIIKNSTLSTLEGKIVLTQPPCTSRRQRFELP